MELSTLFIICIVGLAVAWSIALTCMVIRQRKVPLPVLPEFVPAEHGVDVSHRFGPVADSFDGLWETWICRQCSDQQLRKRV